MQRGATDDRAMWEGHRDTGLLNDIADAFSALPNPCWSVTARNAKWHPGNNLRLRSMGIRCRWLFVKYQLRLSVLAIRTFEPSLNFKSVWEVFGAPLQQDWNRTLGLGYQEPIVKFLTCAG